MFNSGSPRHAHAKLDFIWNRKLKTHENQKRWVKKDMLSLVRILTKRLPKMLCVITESCYARGQTLRMLQILFDWRLTFETEDKSNLIFLHLQNCWGGQRNGKECRICVLANHRSDDNMSTLALSTFISHNYTTLNHCEWKLLICITHSGKTELLIGEGADKHSTLNVFDFLKQRRKNPPLSYPRHLLIHLLMSHSPYL